MKKFLRITMTLSFVAIGAVLIGIGSKPAVVATEPQQQPDKRQEKLALLKIQNFRGEAVALRAKQLRKLNKGIARAMKDAEKRGLRQAFEHGSVIIASDPAASTKNSSSVRNTIRSDSTLKSSRRSLWSSPTQDTFTDGEYEVTFIPYDDGDPNTWEGLVYRSTPEIVSDVRFAVIDIHDLENSEPVALQEIYYDPDGGEPQPVVVDGVPLMMTSKLANPLGRLSQPSQLATCSGAQLVKTSSRSATTEAVPQVRCSSGWQKCLNDPTECCKLRDITPWLRCSAKGCGGSALACSRTGPIFGECWGTFCTGAMLFCLL